jgi:hypothetical protein
MRLLIGSLLVAMTLGGAAAGAADKPVDQAEAARCKTAEVNPVTGHVMCIDPLGAPVEAAPADIAAPCKADESRGQWTWAPNCDPGLATDTEGNEEKEGATPKEGM